MSSVTINGHTYTDDSNTTTGLAAGGHRTRFIPLIQDVVVVADEVESDRAQVATNTATVVADTAIVVADTATAVASAAAALISETNAAASEVAALQYKEDAQAISESGLPSQTEKAGYLLGTNGSNTEWVPGIIAIEYDNRGDLRTNETGGFALVDGLGLFQYVSGSDEPDDDESCFATTNGRWLLEAVHWDVVDAWQLPDDEVRDAFDEDIQAELDATQANWPGKILYGTAVSAVTSLAAVTQTSFTGTLTGAVTTDRVIVTPPNALTGRISIFARVTADNTVTVYLNNPSAATATLVAGTFLIALLKETV
jgi:hypothetical protein